jgi:lysophospholipase L1-like esterase
MPDRRRPPWWLAGVAVALAVAAGGVALWLRGRIGDDDRLDVAMVGDSFGEQSRDQLLAHLRSEDMTGEVSAFGGVAACDWLVDLDAFAAREPRVLILSFAGNDVTPCMDRTDTPSTAAQTAEEYQSDLESILADFLATSPTTRVYVVPPPPVENPEFEANAAAMRAMYARLADEHAGVTVVDVARTLGPDREYHHALPCEDWEAAACGPDGTVVLCQDDGIHLTPAGGERYARAMRAAIGAQ